MQHNTVHSPASVVQEHRHAGVILQWEGGGDHLPRWMKPANEMAQIHHTYSRILQEWVHPVDIWMAYSTEMFHRQQGAQSDSLGACCIPTIPSSVIGSDSKFGAVQLCRKAGYLVIPWSGFLSGPVTCCTMLLCVGHVEGGAGLDQWANVWGSEGEDQRWKWGSARVFPFTFQCVFYSPARPGHPHPVPTTH